MNIQKMPATITRTRDLSATAKEIELALPKPLDFAAGSFVNVFMDIDGESVRRAFSISSSTEEQTNIRLAIRHSPHGRMSPLFWQKDMIGTTVQIMGPLGLNTADKMTANNIFLFAFGVGAGVVKSIAEYFSRHPDHPKLTIVTGSKYADEILYREYFDELARTYPQVTVLHVVSRDAVTDPLVSGYIQDHIQAFDFNHADVYTCGQEHACTELVGKIKALQPIDCRFFIEGFH